MVKASSPQSKSTKISSLSQWLKVAPGQSQSEISASQDFDRGRRSPYSTYLRDTPFLSGYLAYQA